MLPSFAKKINFGKDFPTIKNYIFKEKTRQTPRIKNNLFTRLQENAEQVNAVNRHLWR